MPIGGALFDNVLNTRSILPLPDVARFAESPGLLLTREVEQQWARVSLDNWQRGAQLSMAANVVSVGIPLTEVREIAGEVVRLFDAVKQAIGIDAFAVIVSDALSQIEAATALAREVIGSVSDAMSYVPILAAIARLVAGYVNLIRDEVRAYKESKKAYYERPYSKFLPEADLLAFEELYLRPMRGKDWSSVWSPPAAQIESKPTRDGGWRIGGTVPTGGLGAVPGTDTLHRGLEVLPSGMVQDTGDFLPSARQQVSWIWSGRMGAMSAPCSYAVDPSRLEQAWHAYLYETRIRLVSTYGRGRGSSSPPPDKIRKALIRHGEKAWGWSGIHRSGRDEDLDPQTAFGLQTSKPIAACRKLREIQRWHLGTIAVAYLSPNGPGLADPDLRNLWVERKNLLLSHPDRMLVDLDNVPDPEYRAALIRSGVNPLGGPSSVTAGGSPGRTFTPAVPGSPPAVPGSPGRTFTSALPGRPTVAPPIVPEPVPPPQFAPLKSEATTHHIAALAGLVGVGWILTR